MVSPVGSNRVNSTAGSNVTLAVSFSGAPDPAVIWYMGDLPVVTWTINSTAPPDIADNVRNVVKLEPNGSLTFVKVMINYTNNYIIEMTKPGLGKVKTEFTLEVFGEYYSVTVIHGIFVSQFLPICRATAAPAEPVSLSHSLTV